EYEHLAPDVKKRLHTLVNAWKAKSGRTIGVGLEYQISFVTNPHHITWREFKQFLARWREDRSDRAIEDFIKWRAAETTSTVDAAGKEFARSLLEHYAGTLERASNTPAGETHAFVIKEAADTLQLLERVYF